MNYYSTKTLNIPFEQAYEHIKSELQKEGFGVLTEIDVKETMKKKLDVDFRKYKILGACNPPFAFKALSAEENIGVLMPCNVIMHEKEIGTTTVSVVNPLVSMQAVNNESLAPVAKEITDKLQKVLAAL